VIQRGRNTWIVCLLWFEKTTVVNTRVKIHQYARVKVHQWKADGWVDSGLWQGEREGDYPLAVSLKI
jgi:hypothetical protein